MILSDGWMILLLDSSEVTGMAAFCWGRKEDTAEAVSKGTLVFLLMVSTCGSLGLSHSTEI